MEAIIATAVLLWALTKKIFNTTNYNEAYHKSNKNEVNW